MKIFKNKEFHSHMPFIFEGEYLLFCKADLKDRILEADGSSPLKAVLPRKTPYQAYRPVYCEFDPITGETGKIKEIEIKTPLRSITCNLHAYRDKSDIVHVLYVQTVTSHGGKLTYRLYEKIGKSLSTLGESRLINDTFMLRPYTGFENSKYRVIANQRIGRPFIILGNKENRKVYKYDFHGFDWLRRIIPHPQDVDQFIITYPFGRVDKGNYNKNKTILYNYVKNEFKEIIVDGIDVYKSCVCGNLVIHAVQTTTEENGYCMDLHLDSYRLKSSNIRLTKNVDSVIQARF